LEEKNKNTNQTFALNEKETYTFIIILFALLILSFIVCYNCENIREFGDYISKFFIAGTIIVAILQQLKTKQWNKKQITIKQIHHIRSNLTSITNTLNLFLNTNRKQPYKVSEIHSIFGCIINWNLISKEDQKILEKFFKNYIQSCHDFKTIGETNHNNLRFVFYKQIKDDSTDIINILKKAKYITPSNNYNNQDWQNYDGYKVYKLLHSFLGEYEYIGTAINRETFDIDIVNHLMHTSIIQAYNTFEIYLKHFRKFHSGDTLYKEFEVMKNKIEKMGLKI